MHAFSPPLLALAMVTGLARRLLAKGVIKALLQMAIVAEAARKRVRVTIFGSRLIETLYKTCEWQGGRG